MKKLGLLVTGLIVILGILALNYTKFVGVEHHFEWAKENGMPEPSEKVFYLGVVCAVLGSLAFGGLLARRSK